MSRSNQKKQAKTAQDIFTTVFTKLVSKELQEQLPKVNFSYVIARHKEMTASRRKGQTLLDIVNPDIKSKEWVGTHTYINIIGDDKAFIIDSVIALLSMKSFQIGSIFHPLLHIKMDGKGKIVDVSEKKSEGYISESHIFIELSRRLTAQQIVELKQEFSTVFEDTSLSNRDWLAMKSRVKQLRQELAKAKGEAQTRFEDNLDFLDYVHDDNFTLLGYREYKVTNAKTKIKAIDETGLGLLSTHRGSEFIDNIDVQHIIQNTTLINLPQIVVTKLNRVSSVHRRVPVDAVIVRRVAADGSPLAIVIIIGLFTSVTYSRGLATVPFLRLKAEYVMQAAGYDGSGHGGRALRHILEKYPRDELFQISREELSSICTSIMHLQGRPRIALYIRPDFFGRTVSCLVYIPKDVYDSRLRHQFAHLLEHELNATYRDFQSAVDDSPMVRASFTLSWNDNATKEYDARRIEICLQEAGTPWAARLNNELHNYKYSEDVAAQLTHNYGRAFPESYQEKYQVRQSVHDIQNLEQVVDGKQIEVDFYKPYNVDSSEVSLKIFCREHPITLSNVLPLLENMGLKIIAEYPFQIRPAHCKTSLWMQDFHAQIGQALATGTTTVNKDDIQNIRAQFEECFKGVWFGEIENDSLNRLVLLAGMPWRDVIILRSYVRYLRQTKIPYSLPYMEKALTDHPEIAKLLTDVFHARFNPQYPRSGKKVVSIATIEQKILELLQSVSLLDQDRVLRALLDVMGATLRTNFYQKDDKGQFKSVVSMKFDSSKIKDIPEPKPYREIFVYSPRVEGIHLRCGPIARGGLRWSDRHEDFRTEVLSLMKAQQVKNAVIVPMGAKGGFVVKNPPAQGGREAMQKEGIACYQIYVNALLDITDNRKSGKIIPPMDVVRHDADDPYLVVAADKGTATFSDIANAISLERGFWMGDAFASGGSAGYDHKKMGITARGAWESVKRHFREINHDTQSEEFEVIGVGDMAGDVFGNGLLQSEKILLVGAFNHVHIFCDPAPDAASSYKERARLFREVKGWDHYDTSKLSKGGRIFLRSEKYLKLTPEIQKRFDLDKDTVSPNELIRAMLKSRTDLLFFGGIGTYIKTTTETDSDAGDRSNDALRINGDEIRAKVIGEGANLAMTQRGRIQFAMKGGRLNTDFVDNAAGVDTSDHEVNIKILMADIISNPKTKMTLAARDKLLAGMTGEVAKLVLNDNYQQTQAITLLEARAADLLPEHAAFMNSLEKAGLLNRKVEFLPDVEQIEQRIKIRKGLTRPELSLITSYGKLTMTDALLETNLPDAPVMEEWLISYFPQDLQKKYAVQIAKHQLRREIIATAISNAVVNRMGPTFVRMTQQKTGKSISAVTDAYLLVREAFDLTSIWTDIEKLDNKVPAIIQTKAMQKISVLAERETLWLLTSLSHTPNRQKDGEIYRKGVETLKKGVQNLLPSTMRTNIELRSKMWVENGLPKHLAQQIALLPILGAAFDIICIATESKYDVLRVAQGYFACGDVFRFDYLRGKIQNLSQDNAQLQPACAAILANLDAMQTQLCMRILGETPKADITSAAVGVWVEKNCPQAHDIIESITQAEQSGTLDLAAMVVMEQKLRQLV